MVDDGLSDDDFENVAGGDLLPWLPPGDYPGRCLGRQKKLYSWGEKDIWEWEVWISGDAKGCVQLSRFYHVNRDDRGRRIYGPYCGYRKDWIAANFGKPPGDPRRLPPSIFRNRLLWIEVETVTKDQRIALPAACQYSKVKRVVRPVEPGDEFAGHLLKVIGF